MNTEFMLNVALLILLAITALGIVRMRSLFAVIMLAGLYSLLTASLFVLWDAVDVAFTEASVGAGVSTVLMLAALSLTKPDTKPTPNYRRLPALLIVILTGGFLLWACLDLPKYGDANAPVHTHPMYERFTVTSHEEIQVPNMVTSVLASYRGYDTLGETVVIFTAGVAIWLLLAAGPRRRIKGITSAGDEK